MERLVDLVVGRGPADARAVLLLRLGVLLMSVGYASQAYRQKLEINQDALTEWGASSWLASTIPVVLAAAVLGLGIAIWRRPERWALLSLFSLLAVLTAISTFSFGPLFGLTPPSRAARYLLPIGLLFVIDRQNDPQGWWTWERIGNLFRAAIALTFVGHGVKALFHWPKFLDLLSKSQNTIFGRDVLGEDLTLAVLDFVGLADLTVAALVVFTRWRWVPLYLAAWTFLTASSRVVANGIESWDDIVIRGAYYTVPLAILALWVAADRSAGITPTAPNRTTHTTPVPQPSRLATVDSPG